MNDRRSLTRGRRLQDKRILAQEVWLLVITLFLLFTAVKALNAATSAKNLAQAIQASRYQLTLNNCRDQNTRNMNTITQLKTEIKALPPSRRLEANASLNGTILLIDDLAPYRSDCTKVARSVLPHHPH